MPVPDDFAPLFRTSPVLELIGPIYYRGRGAGIALGLEVAEKHCNARGRVHGGILATLADVGLGYALAYDRDPPIPLVTAHLGIDYVGGAAIGDWLETAVTIDKRGARLAFAHLAIVNGTETIVHASGVFHVSTENPRRSD